MTETTYTIVGTVQGPLWWPIGAPAQKTIAHRTYTRGPGRAFVDHIDSLPEMIGRLDCYEGGDFSGCMMLTADTVLCVERRTAHRSTRRYFPITMFRSIAGYVDVDAWTWGDDDE